MIKLKEKEVLKRALEIAIKGQFKILILTNDPPALRKIYPYNRAYYRKPCPCGNLGSEYHACKCEIEEIQRYKLPEAPIKVEIMIRPQDIEIKEIKDHGLLEAGIKHLGLNYTQVENTIKVAEVIAKIDNYAKIRPEHIAEALSYRNIK